jgi:putative ABC transport system ATP-binding protein
VVSEVFRLQEVIKNRSAEGARFRLIVPRLSIGATEKVAIVGESGSGKSTLLDLLAMVLRPDEAQRFEFRPDARVVDVLARWRRNDQDTLSALRRRHIGYVLQTGGLLSFLSVEENIALPRRLLGLPEDDTAASLARELGIGEQLRKTPGLLSAGQRQRVAIARALAHHPTIVIADEPTASLDPITARKVMTLFVGLVDEMGITLVMASHDWDQIDRLGLRKLRHSPGKGTSERMTESVFADG